MPLISIGHLSKLPRPRAVGQPIEFKDFRLGLNTAKAAHDLDSRELSIAQNIKILPLGALETREGITRYTTSALTNPASHIAYFPFNADVGNVSVFTDTDDVLWADTADVAWSTEDPPQVGSDELIVTKDDNKLYYLSDTVAPVYIDTLEGQATIIPFGDKAILCDGSFLKYWDKATGIVKLLYDDGTGTTGYQADNTDLTEDTQIKLYSGSNTKVGIRFETQAWDTGYAITITSVDAYCRKVGSPTGNIGCELYNNSGSLVATATTTISAASVDTSPELLSFDFSAGDMDERTVYWAVITYSGGDGSNYIQVECDTTTSGGDAKYYDGSWHDDTTKYAMLAVKPGRPPRGQFGLVHDSRLLIGGDSINTGLIWVCAINDCFDWSTSGSGGYIGAIDDQAGNFPVGAMVGLYGDVYIFGKASQPYLCKLTGSSPTDYAFPPLFQKIYSTHKTAIAVVNDIWSGSDNGVNSMAGVEQYGDLRAFSESDAVKDRIEDYWTDVDAFAGYNNQTGQYFLKLPDYPRVLVFHTKTPMPDERGRIRYPITEYAFVKEQLSSSTYKWTRANKVKNGTMELDSNWSDYNTPTTNERSNTQVYAGTYSRKFVADEASDGIQSDTFLSITGETCSVSFRIYPPSTTVAYDIRKGDDSGWLVSLAIGGLTANTWNEVTFSFTETAGGSGAYIVIRAVATGTYYADAVVITSDTEKTYYCELAAGGDPSLSEPCDLLLEDSLITNGTLGVLTDHQWDYGDYQGLGYSTIYLRDDSGDPDTTGVGIWTIIEPTAFAAYGGEFYIAFDDCYIYKLDPTVAKDNSVEVPYTMAPMLPRLPFNEVDIEQYDVACSPKVSGTSFDLDIFSTSQGVDDLDSATEDISLSVTVDTRTDGRIDGNFQKFLPVIRNLDPQNDKFQINKLTFDVRLLSK